MEMTFIIRIKHANGVLRSDVCAYYAFMFELFIMKAFCENELNQHANDRICTLWEVLKIVDIALWHLCSLFRKLGWPYIIHQVVVSEESVFLIKLFNVCPKLVYSCSRRITDHKYKYLHDFVILHFASSCIIPSLLTEGPKTFLAQGVTLSLSENEPRF